MSPTDLDLASPASATPAPVRASPSAALAAASARALSPDAAWRRLRDEAAAPYRSAGRFAWHFARGKLGHDPVFRGLLARGDLAGRGRVVDIGCGQGLMASLLDACGRLEREGGWPAEWPAIGRAALDPAATAYTGVELMPRDVARGEAALARLQPLPRFVCGDMCSTPLPACDVVVILDVLHYVDHAAQAELLGRVHAALAPQGKLLLRVGDMDEQRGFAVSQWVDRVVTRIRGHQVPPTFGRSVAQWCALLQQIGFAVQPVPMSEGTPFANVLLVADVVPGSAAAGGRP